MKKPKKGTKLILMNKRGYVCLGFEYYGPAVKSQIMRTKFIKRYKAIIKDMNEVMKELERK